MRAFALETGVISWDVHTPTLLSFPFLFLPPFPTFCHIQTATYICILQDTHISYSHLFLFTIPYLYSLARWRPPILQFWYSLSLVNRWASSLYPILFLFSNIILFHWWIVLSVSLSRFPLGSTGHRSIHPWHAARFRFIHTVRNTNYTNHIMGWEVARRGSNSYTQGHLCGELLFFKSFSSFLNLLPSPFLTPGAAGLRLPEQATTAWWSNSLWTTSLTFYRQKLRMLEKWNIF